MFCSAFIGSNLLTGCDKRRTLHANTAAMPGSTSLALHPLVPGRGSLRRNVTGGTPASRQGCSTRATVRLSGRATARRYRFSRTVRTRDRRLAWRRSTGPRCRREPLPVRLGVRLKISARSSNFLRLHEEKARTRRWNEIVSELKQMLSMASPLRALERGAYTTRYLAPLDLAVRRLTCAPAEPSAFSPQPCHRGLHIQPGARTAAGGGASGTATGGMTGNPPGGRPVIIGADGGTGVRGRRPRALGKDCGPAIDGCGNVVQRGTCIAPECCGCGARTKCGHGPPEPAQLRRDLRPQHLCLARKNAGRSTTVAGT